MINKETFLKTLERKREYDKIIDGLHSLLNIDVGDSDFIDIPYTWFDTIIETNFSQEGADWIFWYLYDKQEDYKAKRADGTEIKLDTDEDLWNFVNNFGYD